jgi:hypothetical protein
MIKTETYTKDGRELIRRYSDSNKYIRNDQTSGKYTEAIDLVSSGYTYTETDEEIPDEPISAEEALEILLGKAK